MCYFSESTASLVIYSLSILYSMYLSAFIAILHSSGCQSGIQCYSWLWEDLWPQKAVLSTWKVFSLSTLRNMYFCLLLSTAKKKKKNPDCIQLWVERDIQLCCNPTVVLHRCFAEEKHKVKSYYGKATKTKIKSQFIMWLA